MSVSQIRPGVKARSPIWRTGVTSAAVPARNTSVAWIISSGMMWRCTTFIWLRCARLMTERRVMPSSKQSGSGVCSSPFITKKMLAPVASAT
jgi:hypothetical protein